MITRKECNISMLTIMSDLCCFVENLAKLLDAVAVSASILFCQAACRDQKLTLAPQTGACPASQPRVLSKCTSLLWSPQWALVISHLPCLPLPVCLMHALDKTSGGLSQTLLFWHELTNLAIAQEPQSTPPMDRNKSMCPRSCLSLSAPCLDLPVWPLQVRRVLPPGPVNNKPLYFKFSCGLLLSSVVGSPS